MRSYPLNKTESLPLEVVYCQAQHATLDSATRTPRRIPLGMQVPLEPACCHGQHAADSTLRLNPHGLNLGRLKAVEVELWGRNAEGRMSKAKCRRRNSYCFTYFHLLVKYRSISSEIFRQIRFLIIFDVPIPRTRSTFSRLSVSWLA